MPPTKNKSAIPRLGGTNKHADGASSNPAHNVVGGRKPRKSSSSDADAEYTTTADGAKVKVSKPLKMQGPFRPSIVGRMAKTGDWLLTKGKNKPKATTEHTNTNIPRRHSHEEQTQNTKIAVKSKSRSPPERRPLADGANFLNVGHEHAPETEKTRIVKYKRPTKTGSTRENISDLKKENKALRERVDSLSEDISACKETLEKCHIDPVTLEPLKFNEEQISHEKTLTMHQVQESKKAMENILEHNTEMLESLKDMLKGLS